MSLSNDQKETLEKLREFLRRVEKVTVTQNADIDDYISIFRDNGYAVYVQDEPQIKQVAESRKRIFSGEISKQPDEAPERKRS